MDITLGTNQEQRQTQHRKLNRWATHFQQKTRGEFRCARMV